MKVLKVCDVMCRVDVGDRYAVRLCVCVYNVHIQFGTYRRHQNDKQSNVNVLVRTIKSENSLANKIEAPNQPNTKMIISSSGFPIV